MEVHTLLVSYRFDISAALRHNVSVKSPYGRCMVSGDNDMSNQIRWQTKSY